MLSCITLKNTSFKLLKVKNVSEENIYKKCGYKTDNNFKKIYSWDLDDKCIEFQNKASNLIDQLKTIYIPLIENIILKSNYKKAIEYCDKYIRNTPQQVIQRLQNYNDTFLSNVEKKLNEFYTVKGKESQIQILRYRLSNGYGFNPKLEFKCAFELDFEKRIKNIESAIAFRKLVDSRANKQVLKKQFDEYFANELLEIELICKEEWFTYLNKIYFNSEMKQFYK